MQWVMTVWPSADLAYIAHQAAVFHAVHQDQRGGGVLRAENDRPVVALAFSLSANWV